MTTIATSLSRDALGLVQLRVTPALDRRNRLTTAFRLLLGLPHLVLVGGPIAGALSWAWRDDSARHANWTADGGVSILVTGRYPAALYEFAVGALRWNIRVEAYLLLLSDHYPPFSLS